MFRIIIVTLVLISSSNAVAAQSYPGNIRVSGSLEDYMWFSCDITAPSGILEVYIGHLFNDGITQSKFKLSYGQTITYMSEEWYFTGVVGTSVDGVTVDYESCLSAWGAPPILLGKVTFFNPSVGCSELQIVPHPEASSGRIEARDCEGNTVYPRGDKSAVNFQSGGCIGCTWPVETSTWGQIKALYR